MDFAHHIPWGVEAADRQFGGLVRGAFNMLETPDHSSCAAAVGHFLATALNQGERAVLVTFDNPQWLLACLEYYGFDFRSHLEAEELIYIYYKPTFAHALSFTPSYEALFREIETLALEPVTRIGFLNADTLINSQTAYLAKESVQRLLAATSQRNYTVLGCYMAQGSASEIHLSDACAALLPVYMALSKDRSVQAETYALRSIHNVMPVPGKQVLVELIKGYGFQQQALRQIA